MNVTVCCGLQYSSKVSLACKALSVGWRSHPTDSAGHDIEPGFSGICRETVLGVRHADMSKSVAESELSELTDMFCLICRKLMNCVIFVLYGLEDVD